MSFFFPPCNKVGGRRWAKFAKYLSAKKFNVHVLCVGYPYSGVCPWLNDIRNFEKNITRLKYQEHRPYYQIYKAPEHVAGKIRYRLSLYAHNFFESKKKSFNDISFKYRKDALKQAEIIINKRSIDTLVITGGPFHWCTLGVEIKKKYSDINLIVDLRDFWTNGDTYLQLSPEQKKEEELKEFECVKHASYVITPHERILEHLKKLYPDHIRKFVYIPHAFDKEELPDLILKPQNNDDVITFAYGGILYSDMDKTIMQLIYVLRKFMESGKKIKLDIYTFDNSYKNLFEENGLGSVVNYHKTVPTLELFTIFSNTDYLLQLRAGNALEQHLKSTKFYELIALKKPIIYFGTKSDVSDYIISHQLGFDGNIAPNDLVQLIIENKKTSSVPNISFDISQFEFQSVTNTLEKYL